MFYLKARLTSLISAANYRGDLSAPPSHAAVSTPPPALVLTPRVIIARRVIVHKQPCATVCLNWRSGATRRTEANVSQPVLVFTRTHSRTGLTCNPSLRSQVASRLLSGVNLRVCRDEAAPSDKFTSQRICHMNVCL